MVKTCPETIHLQYLTLSQIGVFFVVLVIPLSQTHHPRKMYYRYCKHRPTEPPIFSFIFQQCPISGMTIFSLFLGILSSPSKKLSGTPFPLALGSPASDNSCCSKPSITGVSGRSRKAAASDRNGASSCSPSLVLFEVFRATKKSVRSIC